MQRRLLGCAAVVVVALTLASCLPPTPVAPAISAAIQTPSGPEYRYSWVMAHHWGNWGVQIGPKLDADGIHVAVYAWQNCAGPCGWEFFHEYQTLAPGSVHTYSVTWTSGGWALSADGVVLATLNPGSADPIYEQGSEVTTQ